MTLAAKTATAVALALVLAGCGGGADETDETAATAPEAMDTAIPAGTATPAAGETPTPGATPSESPSPTPSPTATPKATPTPTPTPVAAASPPTVFNQCAACHSTERGENGIGPSLAGVFGRRAGTLAGFEYSQAMKDAGLSWNQANLNRYLENPRGVVPGTTMAYNGVKDAAQRQAVVNYLKTL